MKRHYVGIDLHRRRSVIFTMDGDGQHLGCKRIANDPLALVEAVTEFGPEPEVVVEATYGWYWAVDLLRERGHERAPRPSSGQRLGQAPGEERRT